MKSLIVRLINEDEGQNLVEYALLAGLVALAALVAVTSVGTNMKALYNNLAGSIANIKVQ